MPQQHIYDVVIIGAGTAGQAAYDQVLKTTTNVLVINNGAWDTTCARVGCMPSKLLVEAARRANISQNSQKFGIDNQTSIDPIRVMQRIQQKRDYFTDSVQTQVDHWPEQHKKAGCARFIDATTLQVGEDTICTKATIVATGSTPRVLPQWQAALKDRMLTSDHIFELAELPKSIIVVGTGAIGVELAQALSQLNVEVTLLGTGDSIGGLTSPELRQQATQLMCRHLTYIGNAKTGEARLKDGQVQLSYERDGTTKHIQAEYLLAAIGRETSINTLGLDNIDKKYANIKQPMHNLRTRQLDKLPIFIAGDVLTHHALLHEASFDGRIAGINAARLANGKAVQQFDPYVGLSIVFGSPQMAIVGQSHQQLSQSGVPFATSEVSYTTQGRANIAGKNVGSVQLYGCPDSKKLLGAELLVTEAEHLAHLLAWSIQQQLTVEQLLGMPFYHPTLEEGLRSALVRLKVQFS
ncbi:dihydrolipoyl dehydrogenase [Alkanindiges sp. WGS2144]|uniref:dihydrolipoyl dehydrogenase n=1 Tax=Alkanindiges sp. WGS2144 TaxID=3366808 RepID=UPI003751A805